MRCRCPVCAQAHGTGSRQVSSRCCVSGREAHERRAFPSLLRTPCGGRPPRRSASRQLAAVCAVQRRTWRGERWTAAAGTAGRTAGNSTHTPRKYELQGLVYCGHRPRGASAAATRQRWSLPVSLYKGPGRGAAAGACGGSVRRALRQSAQSRHDSQGMTPLATASAGPRQQVHTAWNGGRVGRPQCRCAARHLKKSKSCTPPGEGCLCPAAWHQLRRAADGECPHGHARPVCDLTSHTPRQLFEARVVCRRCSGPRFVQCPYIYIYIHFYLST